ncbi:MAG: hypothetical protein PVJ61_07090 [Dehalococcoidia bacterium]
MTWQIVVTAILLAWFVAALITFLLNIGQFRRLDKKLRIFLIIVHLVGLGYTIYYAVSLARKLIG